MPEFQQGELSLYYEEQGSGFPLLLIAPGGMRSTIDFWQRTPWNPIEQLAGTYRVIAMDQRNAGRSRAPVHGSDSWHSYTADQLALLNHLGVDRFHVAGMCIGGPYAYGLIQAAPERVASAVLFQTIGLDANRQAFYDMFDSWADELKPGRSEVSDADWRKCRDTMYGGEFLFSVDRRFVAQCKTPVLVLCGKDLYHPESVSREVAALAPNAEFIEHWKEPEYQQQAKQAVADFLARHTPGTG